jgi:hypothetical protein
MLPTGAGHFFIICRRRPQSAGIISPNDIGSRLVRPYCTVSSPYAAKWIHHEPGRKCPSDFDMTGRRQQNGFHDLIDPHRF